MYPSIILHSFFGGGGCPWSCEYFPARDKPVPQQWQGWILILPHQPRISNSPLVFKFCLTCQILYVFSFCGNFLCFTQTFYGLLILSFALFRPRYVYKYQYGYRCVCVCTYRERYKPKNIIILHNNQSNLIFNYWNLVKST